MNNDEKIAKLEARVQTLEVQLLMASQIASNQTKILDDLTNALERVLDMVRRK